MLFQNSAVRMGDVTDGSSNTILFAQAGKDHPVHWMEPSDMDLQYFQMVDPNATAHSGGAHIVLADDSIQFLPEHTDPGTRKAMVTRNGREVVAP